MLSQPHGGNEQDAGVGDNVLKATFIGEYLAGNGSFRTHSILKALAATFTKITSECEKFGVIIAAHPLTNLFRLAECSKDDVRWTREAAFHGAGGVKDRGLIHRGAFP